MAKQKDVRAVPEIGWDSQKLFFKSRPKVTTR